MDDLPAARRLRHEITTITQRLEGAVLELRADHALMVVAASIASQAITLLSECVERGHISTKLARTLALRLADLEFGSDLRNRKT